MLRRLRKLEGWTIYSRNREDVGTVDDFYFDDERWTVRYLVANIGRWGALQETLVPPTAIQMNPDKPRIVLSLTPGQIDHLPSADTRRPIARRYEREYSSQFGYPTFWPSGPPDEAGSPTLAQQAAAIAARVAPADEEEAHLRSVHEVAGYQIHALDGESGYLEDFIADETWVIRYFTVHTGHWPGGRTVLVSPDRIRSIEWERQRVHVDLLRDDIKQSPRYRSNVRLEGETKGSVDH
jgi:hypothetical protein